MLPEPVHPPVHSLPAERRGQAQCPGQAALPPPVAGRAFAVPTLTGRSRLVQHGVPPGPAPGVLRLRRQLHGKVLRKLSPVRGR